MDKFSNKLERLNQEGTSITMDGIFREAFIYYPKTVWMAALAFFTIAVLAFTATSIAVTNYVENPQEFALSLAEFNPIYLDLPELSYYILGMSLISALGSILSAGLLEMVANAFQDKKVVLKTAFKYFFHKIGLYILVTHFGITILFTSLSLVLQMQELSLVALAINWILNALTALVTPLLIFDRLNPIQAIKYSVQIVNKQPFTIITTLLLSSFLIGAGALFFIVGLFFSLPFIYCIYFALYNQTIGFDEASKSEEA